MSDTDTNSNLTNNTPAGLEKEPAADTQWQQELARARELGIVWRECEARLRTVRSDIEKFLLTGASTNTVPAGGATNAPGDDAVQKQIVEIMSNLGVDPFFLIKQGVRDAQRAVQDDRKASPANKSKGALPDDPAGSIPASDDSDNTSALIPPEASNADGSTASGTSVPAQQIQSDTDAAIADAVGPIPSLVPQAAVLPSPGAQSPDGTALSSASGTGATSDGGADLHIQTLQNSGERMRTALEQTTQFTTSLFDQMLSLIDSQNRKLGDVDRKISELNGQINSLKNP